MQMVREKQTLFVRFGSLIEAKATGSLAVGAIFVVLVTLIVFGAQNIFQK
jgi:hypothetical protein